VLRRYSPVVAAAALLLLLDQLSKSWAVSELCSALNPHPGCRPNVEVALGLELRLAFNQGMAFSRFSSSGPIIGLIALAIVAVLLWFSRQLQGLWPRVVVGIVIGGALGNLADRVFRSPAPGNPSGFMRGAVVDFLWTSWWPTFNVADAAVVCGGIVLAIVAWRLPDPDGPRARHDEVPVER